MDLLTTTITRNAVDGFIAAHLEIATVALLARSVMASVPGATDAVALGPLVDALAELDDVADDFVAGDAGAVGVMISGAPEW
jgi:hypothetical protein